MHIAIAGNIGCGKTTLTRMLAKRYGWTPRFEPVDNNPYLADYYADMPRWSFNIQIYFLAKRFKEVVEISKSTETIVQERIGTYIHAVDFSVLSCIDNCPAWDDIHCTFFKCRWIELRYNLPDNDVLVDTVLGELVFTNHILISGHTSRLLRPFNNHGLSGMTSEHHQPLC